MVRVGSRKRAKQADALRARGQRFREVAEGLRNPHQIDALGHILGGQRHREALERGAAATQVARGRQRQRAAESQKALNELARLPRQNIKNPSTMALRELKAFFLKQLFDPQGEIKSFDAMRQFLKQQGICANEGNFTTVFNHMFGKRERELLEKIFQEKRDKPEAMHLWHSDN